MMSQRNEQDLLDANKVLHDVVEKQKQRIERLEVIAKKDSWINPINKLPPVGQLVCARKYGPKSVIAGAYVDGTAQWRGMNGHKLPNGPMAWCYLPTH